MSDLNPRDLELVAIGAAMGSNCPPCMEYHIPQARQAGLSDAEIHAAIVFADKVRQVPARKTLQTALALLPGQVPEAAGAASASGCGCAQPSPGANVTAPHQALSAGPMADMMASIMAHCGTLAPATTACKPGASGDRPSGQPAANACC
jgi:4-carboxymuconolactone decarboxylase